MARDGLNDNRWKQDLETNEKIIYTCVVGGYDQLYPPVIADVGARYIALTDDPNLAAPGWEVIVLKDRTDISPSMLNRRCKLFPWEYLPETRKSIYVDGNIRILSDLSRLFDVIDYGYDIALLRHPLRNFICDEIDACVRLRKIENRDIIDLEYKALLSDGFIDQGLLTENNVIIRSHESAKLQCAMNIWWHFVSTYSGRDQISLHHALSASGAYYAILPFNVRDKNPFFDIYPHFGNLETRRQKFSAHLSARKSEGLHMELGYLFYRIMHRIARNLFRLRFRSNK